MAILKGWRTRILSALVMVLGMLEMFSPDILSTALGLGQRGHAVLFIVFSLTLFWLRQVTTTPAGRNS